MKYSTSLVHNITKTMIQRYCSGVLDTNAFIVGENKDFDLHIQGLFPTASLLNHSCSANTAFSTTNDFVFACRALTHISKGEELTTNYLHPQYHFFGRSYRHAQLNKMWNFMCRCQRCEDSTDLGTMTDGVLCRICRSGTLNIGADSEWSCNNCKVRLPYEVISSSLAQWWGIIDAVPRHDIEELMKVLGEAEKVFHHNHYHILEIKRRIIETIEETYGNDYEHLDNIWLEKKVQFCQDHLTVQRLVSPGLSKYRAYLSFQIAEPWYWLSRKRFLAQKCSKTELLETMEYIADHLDTVIKIWGKDREESMERLQADFAADLLKMVNKMFT